jgi:phosphatidylserine/phosphatidylglycerophosphate/cardiolipin synthase-like enzyme
MMFDKVMFRQRLQSLLKRAHLISAFFVTLLAVLFVFFTRHVSPERHEPPADSSVDGGTIEVFFSAPDDPTARTLRGGPDDPLAASIAGAQRSVDMAAYDLDLWSIRDALTEAHSSGAIVRVVVEGAHYEQPEIKDLIAAGIAVVPDTSEALMHHKFVVVDRWDVWTGSMNFTLNGAYRNDNNLLHLQSSGLAEDYIREFEEMFLEGRYGRLSKRDTPFPELEIASAAVKVYFSPEDGALLGLLEALDRAQEQVLLMGYTLTADEIADTLMDDHRRGMDVRVLLEASQIGSTGNDYDRLKQAGVDILVDKNPYNMHHKVIIIDGVVVIAGSYNFTRSAEERNDENLIIIADENLASAYLVEFTRIWEAAQ